MERTTVSLSSAQIAALDREATRLGRTRSDLIRQAIERVYVAEPRRDELLAAIDASFGAWRDRGETGEAYVDRIRSGRRLARLHDRRGSPRA